MATASQLTVSDAAAHVGVTRQTIFKQIKAGKLSATTNRQGHKQINIVELMRVYGELQSPEQVAQNRINRTQQTPGATATGPLQLELERARMQLQVKEKELAMAQERIEELKARELESKARERVVNDEKQQLLAIVDRQTLLLTAPKPAPRAARPKAAAKAPAPAPVVKKAAPKVSARAPAKTVAKAKAKPAAAKKAPAKVPTRIAKKSAF